MKHRNVQCPRCGRLFAAEPSGAPVPHTRPAIGRDGKHRETPCERTRIAAVTPVSQKPRKRP